MVKGFGSVGGNSSPSPDLTANPGHLVSGVVYGEFIAQGWQHADDARTGDAGAGSRWAGDGRCTPLETISRYGARSARSDDRAVTTRRPAPDN